MPDEQQQPEESGKKQKSKVVQLPTEQKPETKHADKKPDADHSQRIFDVSRDIQGRVGKLEKVYTELAKVTLDGLKDAGQSSDVLGDKITELSKAFFVLQADLNKKLDDVLKRAESAPKNLAKDQTEVRALVVDLKRWSAQLVEKRQRPILTSAALLAFGVTFALMIVGWILVWIAHHGAS